MYLGSGYPKFYIYLAADDTEIDASPIELKHFIIERDHKTLENENSYLFLNPFTKKKIKKSDGYWWREQLTIHSKNFNGTVVGLNDREVDADTQSEFNKITNLIQYANSDLYYIKYVPHDDAERLLNLTPFECNVTVTGQSYQGHKKLYGLTGRINNSGGYAATSTALVVDGLSKTPVAGDEIYFKNQSSKYTVVSYVGTTLTISPGLIELVADDEILSSETYIMNNDTISIMIESKDIVAAPFLPQPSAAPVWVAPADLAVTGYSVDFEWGQVSTFTDYTLQVSTGSAFNPVDIVHDAVVSGMTHTVASLTGETYYARVRVGATGQWSDTLTFYPFEFGKCISMNPSEANSNYAYGYYLGGGELASNTKGQFNIWFYPLAYPTRANQYLMWVTSSSSSTSSFIVSLLWDAGLSGYKVKVEITSGGAPRNSYILTSNGKITLATWHCLGYSFNLGATGNKIKIFLDGEEIAATQTTTGTPPTATSPSQSKYFYFANYYNVDSTNEFSGYIDHIMFIPYRATVPSTLLTDDEMKALWNGGVGRNYPSFAWEIIKFDETSGTVHSCKKLLQPPALTTLGVVRSGGTIIDHT